MKKIANIFKMLFTNMFTITFIYLPIVSQVIIFLFFIVILYGNGIVLLGIIGIIIAIYSASKFGYRIGTKRGMKSSSFFLNFPAFLILIPLLVLYFIAIYVGGNDIKHDIYSYPFILSVNYIVFIAITLTNGETLSAFFLIASTYISFIFGFYSAVKKEENMIKNRKIMLICTIITFLLISLCLFQHHLNSQYIISKELSEKEASIERLDTYNYEPFTNSTKLTKLRAKPTITFKDRHPTIDGATALYPVYASAVEALYKNINKGNVYEYISSTKTPNAYDNLIDGNVDIIFVAEPSDEQLQRAKENGVELIFTPIAKEAFVFFVNSNNTVNNLNIKDIQNIYSGKVTNWDKLGGKNSKILAFQRPVNSGSQTIMLNHIMKDVKIKKPLEEEYVHGMSGIVREVADYRNIDEAIGYSFRFYTTSMLNENGIKLLNINGITPTIENIKNGTYPFTITTYIVSTKNTSENGKKLIEWFLSKQGQELIKDVGYVPTINTE